MGDQENNFGEKEQIKVSVLYFSRLGQVGGLLNGLNGYIFIY